MLFFSTSHLVVGLRPNIEQAWGQTSLEPLRCPVRSSHDRLRSLVIGLSIFRACHRSRWRDHATHPLDSLSSRLVLSTGSCPLLVSSPSNRLTEWLDTARVTGPLLQPRCLDLSLSQLRPGRSGNCKGYCYIFRAFPTLRCCDLRLTYMPDA